MRNIEIIENSAHTMISFKKRKRIYITVDRSVRKTRKVEIYKVFLQFYSMPSKCGSFKAQILVGSFFLGFLYLGPESNPKLLG